MTEEVEQVLTPEEAAATLAEEQRLIREEVARIEKLRQEDLSSRFSSLYDSRMACIGISNPDAYFRDFISGNLNYSEAESILKSIEIVDTNFKQSSFIDTEQQKLIDLRKTRDKYLDSTDRTQLADYPLDSAGKASYRDYRAYLRDIPLALAEARTIVYEVKTYEEFING